MPFQKGKSGNAKGAPKKEQTAQEILRLEGNRPSAQDRTISAKRQFIRRMVELAYEGNSAAIKFLGDRWYPVDELGNDVKASPISVFLMVDNSDTPPMEDVTPIELTSIDRADE